MIDSLVNNGNVHTYFHVYYLLCFLKVNRSSVLVMSTNCSPVWGGSYCTGPNLIITIIFRDPGLFGSCAVNNFWLSRDKTKARCSLKGLRGNNQKSGPFSRHTSTTSDGETGEMKPN